MLDTELSNFLRYENQFPILVVRNGKNGLKFYGFCLMLLLGKVIGS